MTTWNAVNASTRSCPSSVDCSTPMPLASTKAVAAPNATAPTNANAMPLARLIKPDGRALHDHAVADVRDVVVTACQLQHAETDSRADAERAR